MFKRALESAMQELMTLKILILILVFVGYTLSEVDFGQYYHLTVVEFVFHMLSDHFYLINILPLFYLVCLIKLKKNKDILILSRVRNYFDFWTYDLLILMIFTALFILLHVLIATFISLLLFPLTATVIMTPLPDNSSALNVYADRPSLLKLASLIGYQWLGLIYLGSLLRWLELYIPLKGIIFISLVSIIGAMLSLSAVWDFPFLTINNYFILHHAIIKNAELKMITTMVSGFVVMFIAIKKGWGVKAYV